MKNPALLRFSLVILTAASVFSCSGSSKMKSFGVLSGTWLRSENNSTYVEVWEKKDKNTFIGKSDEIVEGDTVFSERVELVRKGEDIYYIVSFPKENAPAVPFRLVSENPWVFENRENDYPQRIIYHKPVKDSLHAYIDGNYRGNFTEMHFYMRRSSKTTDKRH